MSTVIIRCLKIVVGAPKSFVVMNSNRIFSTIDCKKSITILKNCSHHNACGINDNHEKKLKVLLCSKVEEVCTLCAMFSANDNYDDDDDDEK